MSSWSLRWRILAEIVLLVAAVTIASMLFEVPGAVGVGILAVVAGALRARHLSSQFSRITEDVLRTASVDRNHRLSPEGPAELSRMARAVNRLADRLVAAMSEANQERVRLNMILEAVAEGVMLIDDNGIVEFANPTAIRLLGPDAEFEPGDRLISLNNHPELNQLAPLPARTGETHNAQLDIRDTSKTVQVTATALDDRDGRRKSVIIITDITAIKQTETTRREFVSNASHELRTPIAAIKASAETLQRGAGDDPEARRDFLARIVEDSGRVEQMVKEMLELSRLESGQTPPKLESVDVSRFLHQVKDRFEPVAARAGTRIMVDVPSGGLCMNADPKMFEHVFSNLLSNAIKAMSEGGRVQITARESEDGVLLTVDDNGPGIPSAHVPHIFERFYKVDSSRSDGGSGLGLAISRHIVQIHGGEITVDSEIGAGTTFSIHMPAADKTVTA